MKLVALTLLLATSVLADVPVPRPATQAEVNAGVLTQPYVAPATLAGWTGGSSGSNASAITAQQFLAAANVKDISAQRDLYAAVSAEDRLGCWSSVIQASLFLNRYNATNHISVVGNPWLVTNELYGNIAARFNGINTLTVPMPQLLTNFSVTFLYRQDVAAASANAFGYKNAVMSLYDSNTLSSVVVAACDNNSSYSVDTSIGSSFFTAPTSLVSLGSNSVNQSQSGSWTHSIRAMPVFWTAITVSFNSNGLCSTFRNGNTNAWYLNMTNLNQFQGVTTADPLNSLVIGGGYQAWLASATGETNAAFADIAGVIIHNQSCEVNSVIPIADFQFLTDTFAATNDVTKATDFVGASREWNPIVTFFFTGVNGIPITNEWSVLYAQAHPDELVFNDAYPGSKVADYFTTAENPGVGANPISVLCTPSIAHLDPVKYAERTIKECSGDNDAFAGTAISTIIGNHNAFYLPYLTNGIKVALFRRASVGAAGATSIQNAALHSYFNAVQTQFPFSDVYDEETSGCSLIYLALVACDVTHVGATNTLAGYYGASALATFMYNKASIPFTFANYLISSTALPSTNSMSWPNYGYSATDTNGNHFVTYDGSGLTNLSPSAVTAAQNSALPPGVIQFYDASMNSIYSNTVTHDVDIFATNFFVLTTGSEVHSNSSISIVGTGQFNGLGTGLTNASGLLFLTNSTAASSSTNIPGTDQTGKQVSIPWASLPSGGGGSTANTIQTNVTSGTVSSAIYFTNSANSFTGNLTNTEEFAFLLTNNFFIATNLDGVLFTNFYIMGHGQTAFTNWIGTASATIPVYFVGTNGTVTTLQKFTNQAELVIGTTTFIPSGGANVDIANLRTLSVTAGGTMIIDSSGDITTPTAAKLFVPSQGFLGSLNSTNGITTTVTNSSYVNPFTIGSSVTTFLTNSYGRNIYVGFTATTVTGVGLCATNGGATSQFVQFQTPLTGGGFPLINGGTVSFTNGITAGNGTWIGL